MGAEYPAWEEAEKAAMVKQPSSASLSRTKVGGVGGTTGTILEGDTYGDTAHGTYRPFYIPVNPVVEFFR